MARSRSARWLAANPWTDAKARIEADIPQELRDCAEERANVELKRLENDNKKVTDTATLPRAWPIQNRIR
jgi:hypothetical protein